MGIAAAQRRIFALVGHTGSGKTSLGEAILFATGATDRLGGVEGVPGHFDSSPEEVAHRMSIDLGVAEVAWQGHRLTVVDVPGYPDFAGERVAALRAADVALLVVDGGSGPQVGTLDAWADVVAEGLPAAIVVTKLDHGEGMYARTIDGLRAALGERVIPFMWPLESEGPFRGVADLLRRAVSVGGWDGGAHEETIEIEVLGPGAVRWREALVDVAAEADDNLLERYLEGAELGADELSAGLRAAVVAGKAVPVFCVSSVAGVGMQALLDAVIRYLPSPEDRSAPAVGTNGALVAQAFKTFADPYVGRLSLLRVFSGTIRPDSMLHNASKGVSERVAQVFSLFGREQKVVEEVGAGGICAVAKLQATATGDTLRGDGGGDVCPPIGFPRPRHVMAMFPKARGDEERLSAALARLVEEDPSIEAKRDPETRELLLAGIGELHLEVAVQRLRRRFNVEVELSTPRVPYRETIRRPAKAEGKHKKQTGGRGQFGHVFLEVEPLPRGSGNVFAERIFGGAVPRQYIPAVEKGVRETLEAGILAGYPGTDIRVVLYDGSFHPVDSSELAFKIAASLALKKAFQEADPVLLEPLDEVEVKVPAAAVGDVTGDINKRRGHILGIEAQGEWQVVRALVPAAELARYAIELRSLTQGMGRFSRQFAQLAEVPSVVARQVMAGARTEGA